jgi:hypothetical protein
MRKWLLIVAIIMLAGLIVAPAAQAFTWTHVGGDPLVPGGVWDQGKFGQLLLNSSKVRTALSLVRNANGQPAWVLTNAYDQVSKGNIKSSSITRGTRVGAMSYGRNVVRVVKNTVYMGQYKYLPYFYVCASKTTVVKINGICYQQTVSYRVSMAKHCGNVFIFKKKTVKKRMFKLTVEKRCNSATGARLPDWKIKGTADGKDYSVTTKADSTKFVAWLLPGKKYDFSEVTQDGYEVVVGHLSGIMPKANKTLTFVNKKVVVMHKIFAKKINFVTCELIGGWGLTADLDGRSVNTTTSGTDWRFLGEVAEGGSYSVTEETRANWVPMSPETVSGTMGTSDVYITFENKFVPPEVPKHHVFVKKLNFDTGAQIGGWGISGFLDGQSFNDTTQSSGWKDLGLIAEGTSYSVTEETRADWVAKTATTVSGTMGTSDVYITFKNKFVPPEVPKHHVFVKKINFDTGAQIGGWGVSGSLDGQSLNDATQSSGWKDLGLVAEGRSYSVTEETRAYWVAKTATTVSGTMGTSDVYITFKNQFVPPEVPKHKIFVKKINFDTGAQIGGWGITGDLDGLPVSDATSSSGWKCIGEVEEGGWYSVSEESRQYWNPKTPSTVSGTMGTSDVYITFKNQYCPPPPPHVLEIEACVTPLDHGSFGVNVTLDVTVLRHSDGDEPLRFSWYVNGVRYDTLLYHFPLTLEYGKVYSVSVIATDPANHMVQATIPPFNFQDGSDPPPPPASRASINLN